MNPSITFREDQWSKIVSFLRTCPGVYVGRETACRRFLEGVLWMLRSGAQWRLLPKEYGNWNSVYKRFARWCDQEIWHALHQHFADDPDMENAILDSTVVRAHPCAAGARKKDGGQGAQALGRSRGGFSTKIHVNVDALGNPLRFLLTAGQRHDMTQAEALIAEYDFERLIADRAYDADDFLQVLADKAAEAVIPPRRNRKETRDYDRHLYKERHLVECFINKIKHYRRIFSRFDKLAQRYLGFLSLAGALIWLR
jgi:transposase